MEPVKAVLIGAGGRGFTFAHFAKGHPYSLKIVAVAEPREDRRNRIGDAHGIPPERRFGSWTELLAGGRLAEAAIITTMDHDHFQPAMEAMRLGYHVLLEKPMSPFPEECLMLADQSEAAGRILSICHSLRYTAFFQEIKRLLDAGEIGELISIQHTENVGYWHQAHSFVRGNWRNLATSSPMLLAKSCHDIDVLCWLVDAPCTRVSSFGSLSYFRKENAPPGAPPRCTDGCPVESSCAYSALKIYMEQGRGFRPEQYGGDLEAAFRALHESPFSRCVFQSDNDVVDHQVVNMEFANGVTVAFTMCAFSAEVNRTIKLFGTHGEIRGDMERGEVEVTKFLDGKRQVIRVVARGGHAGGDDRLAQSFVDQVRAGRIDGLTSGRVSAETHLVTFAAEEARLEGTVISVADYIAQVERRIAENLKLQNVQSSSRTS